MCAVYRVAGSQLVNASSTSDKYFVCHAEPFPVLVPLLASILASGAEAYICTTIRQTATFEYFLRLVHQSGLQAEEVAQSSYRAWPVQFLECLPLSDQSQRIVIHRLSAMKIRQ